MFAPLIFLSLLLAGPVQACTGTINSLSGKLPRLRVHGVSIFMLSDTYRCDRCPSLQNRQHQQLHRPSRHPLHTQPLERNDRKSEYVFLLP